MWLAGSYTPSDWLGLWRWFDSIVRISLRLSWEDSGAHHDGLSGLDLLSFSSALILAIISSACSSCSTNCFQVWHSVTPIWASREVYRLWRHVCTSIDSQPLEQWSAMLWNLSRKVLIDSPFFCLAARRVGTEIFCIIFKKWARNNFSRSAHVSRQEVSWTIQRWLF